MREELFGDMSTWEIIGEVVAGLLLIPVGYVLVVLIFSL